MESDGSPKGGGEIVVAVAASPSSASPAAAASPSLASPTAAASPSSASRTAAGRSHPSYKEMIVQALTELREPGGSTRLAIAKYVADRFSNLPASHDALLYAHLRRLESEGVLNMNGYLYVLSSSPKQRRGRGRPPKIRSPDATAPVPRSGEKRGRGRPRKNAIPVVESSSVVQPQLALTLEPATPSKNVAYVPVLGEKRGRGRPRKSATPVTTLSVLGEKRGRGRPRKSATPVAAAVPVLEEKLGRGWPRKSATRVAPTMPVVAVKRGRGRPPKVKNALILTAKLGTKLNVKRRRGRPRKSVQTMGGLQGSSENTVVTAGVAGARRGRGRPRKVRLPARVTAAALAMLSLALGKRKRGRPPMGKRRPGRPTKDKTLQLGFVLAGDGALTKRGRGRPRKEKTMEVVSSEAGGAVAEEMTEAGPIETGAEAKPGQAIGETGTVQNGGEASSLQSGGASLTQKRGRGRPKKETLPGTEPVDVGVASLVEKRPRGRPRKEKPSTARSAETGNDVSMGMKRGRGRPRVEKTVKVVTSEAGGAVPEEMTEAGTIEAVVEAQPIQVVHDSGTVENGGIASSFQSVGTPSTEKRGRGRPRKQEPSIISNKRRRGRPRKDQSFETGFDEPAGQVSRDLTEARPTEDKDLVAGEKIHTEGVTFKDREETRTADAGYAMLSGENAASAPVDAGDADGSNLGSM